jgi:hypothetical protein
MQACKTPELKNIILPFTPDKRQTCQIFVKNALDWLMYPCHTGAMTKIIRRTIIVTITETWTIVWHENDWGEAGTPDAPEPQVMTITRVSRKISLVEAPSSRGATCAT